MTSGELAARFKQRGNVVTCVMSTAHHAVPSNIEHDDDRASVHYRLKAIENGLEQTARQIHRIKAAAEEAKCTPVLDLLNEEFDFCDGGK